MWAKFINPDTILMCRCVLLFFTAYIQEDIYTAQRKRNGQEMDRYKIDRDGCDQFEKTAVSQTAHQEILERENLKHHMCPTVPLSSQLYIDQNGLECKYWCPWAPVLIPVLPFTSLPKYIYLVLSPPPPPPPPSPTYILGLLLFIIGLTPWHLVLGHVRWQTHKSCFETRPTFLKTNLRATHNTYKVTF